MGTTVTETTSTGCGAKRKPAVLRGGFRSGVVPHMKGLSNDGGIRVGERPVQKPKCMFRGRCLPSVTNTACEAAQGMRWEPTLTSTKLKVSAKYLGILPMPWHFLTYKD